MLLTDDELQELTGRKRRDAQVRELAHLRIPFARRSDGSIVVLRSVVETLLGGGEVATGRGERPRVRLLVKPEPKLLP